MEKVGRGLAPAASAISNTLSAAFEVFTKEGSLESHLDSLEKQEKRLRNILTVPGLGPERARYEKELEGVLTRRAELIAKAAQKSDEQRLAKETPFGPFATEQQLKEMQKQA